MNDPYKNVFEDIAKCMTRLGKMIDWLAKRTLSVKEYMEFADEFSEKNTNDKIIDSFLKTEKE